MPDPLLLARSRDLARMALASAAALVVLALLFPFVVDRTAVSDLALLIWGLFLLLAAIILGVSLAYVFMTRGLRTDRVLEDGTPARPDRVGETGTSAPPSSSLPEGMPESAVRLLAEDERRIYRRVVEAGGMVLQKDLVRAGPFSGSKVTRILDRLEGRGLIERERHGMTNRIRVSDAWRRRV